MEIKEKIVFLKSKLKVYRHGLDRARQKGNLIEVNEWMKTIANLKKEIEMIQ